MLVRRQSFPVYCQEWNMYDSVSMSNIPETSLALKGMSKGEKSFTASGWQIFMYHTQAFLFYDISLCIVVYNNVFKYFSALLFCFR